VISFHGARVLASAHKPVVHAAAALPHHRETGGRLERADQHAGGMAGLAADEIGAPVDGVRAVDVDVRPQADMK
jgi:hypothetical protein